MISEDQVRGALGPVVEREHGGPPGWERDLVRFLDLLARWNRRMNLVSPSTAARPLEAHVLPSLATLLRVEPDSALCVLDIGSGGGFPGIPLQILRPRVRLDLVEATRKKCRFLEHCVRELGLDACVHWCRAEAPSPDLLARAPFDLAFARAVGSEKRLVEGVRGLLRTGGEAWAFTAPGSAEDLLWTDAGGRGITALRRLV